MNRGRRSLVVCGLGALLALGCGADTPTTSFGAASQNGLGAGADVGARIESVDETVPAPGTMAAPETIPSLDATPVPDTAPDASTEPIIDTTAPDGYELVFADEFDGEQLRDEWSTCFWWQVDGGCTIITNQEQQWYRPEGVSVADGVVSLTATVDEQTTTEGAVLPFRSGMISTGQVDYLTDEPGFAFTYGYVEARVRFPEGAGVWPAVWLLSADKTPLPEIDILEWYGSRPTETTGHVHQRVDGERVSLRVAAPVGSIAGEWHEVAVLWTEDRVEFFFDGDPIGSVDDPLLVPSSPMYLIANLALGGISAGEVDTAALPQSFDIDWIRVWQ